MLLVFVMNGLYNNHQMGTLLPLKGGGEGNEYTVFVRLWPAIIKSLSSLPVKEAFTHPILLCNFTLWVFHILAPFFSHSLNFLIVHMMGAGFESSNLG